MPSITSSHITNPTRVRASDFSGVNLTGSKEHVNLEDITAALKKTSAAEILKELQTLKASNPKGFEDKILSEAGKALAKRFIPETVTRTVYEQHAAWPNAISEKQVTDAVGDSAEILKLLKLPTRLSEQFINADFSGYSN